MTQKTSKHVNPLLSLLQNLRVRWGESAKKGSFANHNFLHQPVEATKF